MRWSKALRDDEEATLSGGFFLSGDGCAIRSPVFALAHILVHR